MSVTFDPQNRLFKINEIIFKPTSYNIIDYYNVIIKNTKDIELLSILNNETENKNGSIIVRDKYGNDKEVKYVNNEKIKNDYLSDIQYFYYTTLQYDLNNICIEIYKTFIEKYILIRANKIPNIDYMFDIYIIMNNDLCENINNKFNEIFKNLCECANLRIHFMNVKIETNYYDYTKSCAIC